VLWVCSFLWVFLGFLCGLAELLLCILPVYLGAPYAFLMKFSYLSKKKNCEVLVIHFSINLLIFILPGMNIFVTCLSFPFLVRCFSCICAFSLSNEIRLLIKRMFLSLVNGYFKLI
jgi:hypothetical protein